MKDVGRIFRVWLTGAFLASGGLATSAATPEQDVLFASRDAERYFERGGLLLDDADALAYLHGVLRRVVGDDPDATLADCRVFLLRGVHANAFALPTCRVYVSTAMLMSLENEEQLAAVIARELTHVQIRSVAKYRRILTQQIDSANFFSNVFAAGGGVRVSGISPNLTDAVGDLIWRVSVRGFSDEIELEADRGVLARLAAAGFKAADGIRAFENLRFVAATPAAGKTDSLPLMANKLVLDAHLARLRMLAGGNSDGAAPAASAHGLLASKLRVEQIRTLIKGGDLPRARELLESLASSGENGMTWLLRAELELRGGAPDEVVLAAYDRGGGFADAPAKLFLDQGLMLREMGEDERARRAFSRYLELAPESAEAPLVRDYLNRQTE